MNLNIPKFTAQAKIGVVSLIIVAVLLTLGYHGYTHYQPGFIYVVAIDGQEVGIVRNLDDLETITNHLTDQAREKTGYEVMIVQELVTTREFQLKPEIHLPNLQYKMAQNVTYEASGTLILVGDEPTVIVQNQEIAENIIADISKFYADKAKGKIVNEPKVLNDVSYMTITVKPEEIVDMESARSLLLRGTTKYETYTVSRGDSLWSIANRAGISIEELKKANSLNTNVVNAGQELTLTTAEPLIEVELVEEVALSESIPFSTQWRNTSSLFYFQTSVHTQGSAGKRDVIYQVTSINGVEKDRKQIRSEIVSEPVTRIAERGTALLPTRATGRFRWPLQPGVGRITSPFGNRSDPFSGRIAFHTGVDVAAAAGTPLYAAEGGTVKVAGYQGSYGNLVVIQHSNGYATYYAHLQNIRTSVGATVSKGQVIGTVGRTGSATGNHVHFEIRTGYGSSNGNPTNPLNFYAP